MLGALRRVVLGAPGFPLRHLYSCSILAAADRRVPHPSQGRPSAVAGTPPAWSLGLPAPPGRTLMNNFCFQEALTVAGLAVTVIGGLDFLIRWYFNSHTKALREMIKDLKEQVRQRDEQLRQRDDQI